ncbi:hypothetical protein [uncultured Litoreibacter sp.]|uniref:hypothetical protein n=1 Tax=uncultured Litoreibacter sp. TaxID=1392394 RepID=UPI002630D501|nr:hypothetical protein [uncultured Litoreibacter sp.]
MEVQTHSGSASSDVLIQMDVDLMETDGGYLRVLVGRPEYLGYENLDELLPYDGTRGVVGRSASAKTGAFVARTEEDGYIPRVVGHESSLERATAIRSLLHPNVFGLKCQPRKVYFSKPIAKLKSNTLDYLVTLKTGQKYYLYVKNEESLSKPKHALICEEIRKQLPAGYGFAAVSEAEFPPYVRGNNDRMFLAKRFPDPDADQRLLAVLSDLIDVDRFTVEELVFRCELGPKNTDKGRAFDAVLRAIADHKLVANRRELIDYPTVLGLPG